MITTTLRIDEEYRNTNNWKHPKDEFNKIFKRFKDGKGIQNVQGFRWKSKFIGDKGIENSAFVVIVTNFNEKEWPDELDYKTGIFTYYGDNRKGGSELHSKSGNKFLRTTFDRIHLHKNRNAIPPVLVFEAAKKGKDNFMKFLGLAAPGAADFLPTEDLVAVWRVEKQNRFQNYRSFFTILKEEKIDLRWLDDLCEGIEPASSPHCPKSWSDWVMKNTYNALECESLRSVRMIKDQKPTDLENEILKEIFEFTHREFEFASKEILKLVDKNLYDLIVTRSVRDKGIDIIGKYKVGQKEYSHALKVIGEAKRWKSAIGVNEVKRLISRMTKDSIGFFVTTSHYEVTVQEEIIEDERPIVLICGKDIVQILQNNELAGNGYEANFKEWIEKVKFLALAN